MIAVFPETEKELDKRQTYKEWIEEKRLEARIKVNEILKNARKETLISKTGWDSSIGFDTFEEKAKRKILEAEEKNKENKNELARVFDRSGKIVLKRQGTEDEVSFFAEEIKTMKDCLLNHNHTNCSCFSPEDINMLRRGKLQEIRATTPFGIYRLERPEKWSKEISSFTKIEEMYYNINKEISKQFYGKAEMGKISYALAERMSQEAVIEEFASRYGLKFRFDAFEDVL